MGLPSGKKETPALSAGNGPETEEIEEGEIVEGELEED